MTWFDKHRWSRHRASLGREALAASVEELTAREKPSEDAWDEEEEEDDVAAMGGTMLIPPRLRLQSRPLPIVRIDVTKHVPMKREPARMSETAADGAAAGKYLGRSTEEREAEVAPLVTAPSKRLGRSTKVHLQAVRPGQEPITEERVPIVDVPERREPARDMSPARDRQAIARRAEPSSAASSVAVLPMSPPSSLLCGRGTIEAGQEDATVHNPRISAQSVVTVMLAGNPGPVVVHYISLQPRAGFTLHMSAPVTAATPFNYAIWLF